MQRIRFIPTIFIGVWAAACASTPASPELVDARRAYAEARASHAAAYGPDRLLEAKQALDRAEAAHEDDAGSFEERRQAYVAERRAHIARAYGDYVVAKHDEDAARRAYVERQEELRRQAEAEASARERELEATRDRLSSVQSDARKTREQLQRERQTRTQAEERAAAAVASLKELATVKEEARGTVITLSGSVLFLTGQAELLPIAERKLESVAKALVDLEPTESIVIEGHTDARGAEDTNQKLSEERANAVRDYLVAHGVSADRVRTVGLGESKPIASNATPEGRANNRRVEIVIRNGNKPGKSEQTPAVGNERPRGIPE
jgi:outer membrane protein OmpA-like peptidoglycan-associated protein